MTDSDTGPHRRTLQRIARRAVRERGLLPDFFRKVLDELDHIHRPASCMEEELSANVERGYIHSTKAGQ